MRPEGCQETRPRAATISRNSQISNQFLVTDCLTLSETGTYTDRMTNRLSLLRRAALRSWRSSAPAPLARAGASSASMYVSVARRRRRAGPRPRPGRLHRPRRQRRARGAAASRRPTDPMQIARARRQQPGRRAASSATIAQALPAFVDALIGRRRRPAEERGLASSRSASGRPSSTDYTTDHGRSSRRASTASSRMPGSGHLPARRHHRDQPGLQEARARRARSSSRSPPKVPS